MGAAAERKRARQEARQKAEEEAARRPAHEESEAMLAKLDEALAELDVLYGPIPPEVQAEIDEYFGDAA